MYVYIVYDVYVCKSFILVFSGHDDRTCNLFSYFHFSITFIYVTTMKAMAGDEVLART